ncbi:MAG: AAA family ATPase [Dokdonella sp.]
MNSERPIDNESLAEVGQVGLDPWPEDNNRYLSSSLNWLRLKLQRAAAGRNTGAALSSVSTTSRAAGEAEQSTPLRKPPRWYQRSSVPSSSAESAPFGATAPAKIIAILDTTSALHALDSEIESAAEERQRCAQVERAPALPMLAQQLGLSPFETDILLLCTAMELDPSVPTLISAAQGGGHAQPSFSLAMQIFDQPSWDALAPQRPLRYLRLLEINQPGAMPLTAAALRIDERIVNTIKGLNLIDERLAGILTRVEPLPAISESQNERVEAALATLRAIDRNSDLPTMQLLGHDPGSRRAIAAHVADALGRDLHVVLAESLPTPRAEIETLARLWQRESLLLPVALYVEADAIDTSQTDGQAALRTLLGQPLGLCFVGLRETPLRLVQAQWTTEAPMPTPGEQHAAWLEALPEAMDSETCERQAEALSGHYRLNLDQIGKTASIAALRGTEPWDECRDLSLSRLDSLAQRLDPKAHWDDLIVSDEAAALLRQITGQVHERHRVYQQWGFAERMNRGMGISALFAGESGTGKTMAAEVIANELRMHLYRIDLSSVVSKYIGETEKNLRRLFDAAEQGGAILLFDEADALFGKRSEVKDSHDRYANIEINYLLQRMEAFSGLAILATNMKSALDTAFMRRLRFVVTFQFPGPNEREKIWRNAFAPGVPREDLDYGRLARFSLSGGNIHSVALNATFAAAGNRGAVSMPLLIGSIRTELRKLDKPVNESEFRDLASREAER